ncbi:MAG: hypothetical protein IPN03_06720 [Holophagales bacterium]|nr:hypothetical protein [Holophagales bacterium]
MRGSIASSVPIFLGAPSNVAVNVALARSGFRSIWTSENDAEIRSYAAK